MGTDNDHNCFDCGVSIAPRNEYDEPIRGEWEWYMVKDSVWREALGDDDDSSKGFYFCIGCIEKRLGRELASGDFTYWPINGHNSLSTQRLIDRTKDWIGFNLYELKIISANEWNELPMDEVIDLLREHYEVAIKNLGSSLSRP